MKIFIVVLNWNQPKLTVECVESLEKLKIDNKDKLEVIIVDNGSSDNSLEELRKLRSKKFKIEVLAAIANLGFAGGNNFGMKYALSHGADYIMILNNDTLVHQNLLNNLLNEITKDDKTGIVSPKIYFAKGFEFHKKYKKNELGKVIWYAGGKIDWNNVYGINIGVDEVDKGQFEKIKEIDFATGACLLIKANTVKQVGMFDEKYFMYLEDADLSQRIKKRGWKIIYVPTAVLWHKVAQSSGIGSDLNDYFISRNRLLFASKYSKLRTKLALIKESIRLFIFGRHWQAVGIRDFYLKKFSKGSWGRN
jgi:GT2 family glycosyltransferase